MTHVISLIKNTKFWWVGDRHSNDIHIISLSAYHLHINWCDSKPLDADIHVLSTNLVDWVTTCPGFCFQVFRVWVCIPTSVPHQWPYANQDHAWLHAACDCHFSWLSHDHSWPWPYDLESGSSGLQALYVSGHAGGSFCTCIYWMCLSW